MTSEWPTTSSTTIANCFCKAGIRYDIRELLAWVVKVVSLGWAPAEVTDLLDVVKVDMALMWPVASPLSLLMLSISLVQVTKLLRKRRK